MSDVVFALPRLGQSMTNGSIAEWFVDEGSTVAEGDELCIVETDKVTQVIESPLTGRVKKIAAAVGDEIDVGATIIVFEV